MTLERRIGPAHVRFTDRTDGDMRRALLELPWTWLLQEHGSEVVKVDRPGGCVGARGDAAVTDQPGAALAVLTADCAPVALVSSEGPVGVAHAGWGGLLAGVLPSAVHALRDLGASDVQAVIGPCIHAECYEFGTEDLDRLIDRFGPDVASSTPDGAPALDLPAAVRAALAEEGVAEVEDVDICTGCSPEYFSWRARKEHGRQATVVWR